MKTFISHIPLINTSPSAFLPFRGLTRLKKLRRICRMTPGKVALRSSCTPVGQLRYIGSFSMSFSHWKVHHKKKACVKMMISMIGRNEAPHSRTTLIGRDMFSIFLLHFFKCYYLVPMKWIQTLDFQVGLSSSVWMTEFRTPTYNI